MPAAIPDMKFDKDQTPWARWAQNEITALTQRLAAKDASDSNINQGSSATLALLGGQIQALADAEGTLATQQATLATTVSDLATTEATLTATVTNLSALAAYYSQSLSSASTSTNNAVISVPGSLSFTLTSTRNVLVRMESALIVTLVATGTNATSSGLIRYSLKDSSGTLIGSTISGNGVSVSGALSETKRVSAPDIAENLFLALPADTYTVTCQVWLNYSGTGATGAVIAGNPTTLYAQVIS